MIKNKKILEDFEKGELPTGSSIPWYARIEQLYQMGLKLNAHAIKNGGEAHLKMLIQVQKKLKFCQNESS